MEDTVHEWDNSISSTKQSSSFTTGRLFYREALTEEANSSLISFNHFTSIMNLEKVKASATIANHYQKYSHLSLMVQNCQETTLVVLDFTKITEILQFYWNRKST